ncbi:unnamed protein product [Parascedosporium putredinis]|uniref:Major facilitator superfamily (MFS) profile domain-containing protein n=1 Tax=Parascedosporium putredinis TaxID=1442378 RepID=A0A9P1H149_9PEZI|nr:unnamed protein product [Parascedosporium putredinis]CAI7993327.1 unnamed protein product [Parascedosporium putredinis]
MPIVSSHAEDTCLKTAFPRPARGRRPPAPREATTRNPPSPSLPPPLSARRRPSAPAGPAYPHTSSSLASVTGDDNDDADGETYPEGGLQAWLVVFGSFCTMGAVFGLTNSAGVFEAYFKQNQLAQYSHSQIGWIFSLYLFLVFFVGIQVGPVFDHYGPRLLVAVGSLTTITSLMLLSLCKNHPDLRRHGRPRRRPSQRPAYGAIAHFFHKRRGLATGIATTAGGLGGIVFPILLQFLLGDKGVGFPWTCRILGFIFIGLCIPSNLFIRSRLPPKLVGLFVPLTYIVSYARAQGHSESSSSMLLALLNAGSVVGRFLPGLLADKFGRFNVIITTNGLCAVAVLGLWTPAHLSNAVLVTFCVVFGFASGSNLGLYPVCIGQFCDSQSYGRYYSTTNMVASFGTLSSLPIGGALVGLGGQRGWTALIIFCGLSYVAAMTCYVSARVSAIGWKVRKVF